MFHVFMSSNQQALKRQSAELHKPSLQYQIPVEMHPPVSSSYFHSIILALSIVASLPTVIFSVTLAFDKEALRLLKHDIDPNTIPKASFIDSWDFSLDPCDSTGGQFQGILCSLPLDNSPSRITAINLDSSGYDGFLTPAVGNLTELKILNLGRNNFRGPIPDSISNLKKIITFSISGNFFTGPIPKGIASMKTLENLDLSYNNLSNSIPPKLAGLRSLTRLILSNNGFFGRIPDLDGAWQLRRIELDNNLLYGNLPKLPIYLETLSLSHNSLSGHISGLAKLKHLVTVNLSRNRFTGLISSDIVALPKVVSLDVSVNQLTAIEVTKFEGRETHLRELNAQGNLLQGHLPVNLVTIGGLTSINLGRNKLSGHIPVEYGAKLGRSWTSLFLDHNFLAGNVPAQLSSGSVRIRGSLASNCLRCPVDVSLCRGGQRPVSECVGQND